MKIKVPFILILVITTACEPLPPTPDTFLPLQNDAAILRNASYISHTTNELTIETDVVVLNSFYRGFDNDYLLQEDFEIQGEGLYEIVSFDILAVTAPSTPASHLLLIDQSGSYQELDPYNTRSQAMSKFIQDVSAQNELLIAAAAQDGNLLEEPIEFSADEFGTDAYSNSLYIFGLSKRTGGQGMMIKASDEAVEKLKTSPVRKELVLFTHSNDPQTSVTSSGVIAKAKLNGITISVISFGEIPDKDVHASLAIETGGLYAVCPTEKEIVKVFSELERLINGELSVYRLRIKFKPTDVNMLQPGTATKHTIQITDPFSGKLYSPVFINLKIPS